MPNYTPFVRIELSHGYFGEAKIDFLSITPSRETAEFLKKAEILYKPDPDGLQLFHSQNSSHLIASLPDKEKLTFHLLENNPLFWSVTEIPPKDLSSAPKRFVNGDDAHTVNVLMEHTIEHETEETRNSKPADEHSKIYPENLVGLIEIDFDPQGSLPAKNYGIRFEARPVYWRYHLMSGEEVNLAMCQIKSTRKDIHFSDLRIKKLDNGSVAFESRSTTPIEMSHRFNFSNSLVGEGLGIDQKIPLPNADPAMITKDEDGNFSVSLFVYL